MARSVLIWALTATLLVIPVLVAATSPLLAWRGPVYIFAGFAGIVALGLLLLQPLSVGGYLPGLRGPQGRKWHKWIGGGIVAAVVLHVGGLWITSPPDVIDVLLFRSPTPFSEWGAFAMLAVFATAILALLRHRLRLGPRTWRLCHASLAGVIVVGSVVHALLIEGTMGTVSKVVLCIVVSVAAAKVLHDLPLWRRTIRKPDT